MKTVFDIPLHVVSDFPKVLSFYGSKRYAKETF